MSNSRELCPVPVEILPNILEFLHDDSKALCSCLLVNSVWQDFASDVIWQRPAPSILASIAPERRPYYAAKVVDLTFSGDDDGALHYKFTDLKFPRLRRLSLDFFESDGLRVDQYMQRNLWVIKYYGGTADKDLLPLLSSRCPNIQSIAFDTDLYLDNDFDPPSPLTLLEFCKSRPSLVKIWLGAESRDLVSAELLAHLAERKGLVQLTLPTLRDRAGDSLIKSLHRPTFADLRDLRVFLGSELAKEIPSMVPGLVHLNMTLQDAAHDFYAELPKLKHLQVLKITYEYRQRENIEIAPSCFKALSELPGLTHLSILSLGSLGFLFAPRITDDDILRMCTKARALREVSLMIQCWTLSYECLIGLGRLLPFLETCYLLGGYNVYPWKFIEKPLFPRLKNLDLSALTFQSSQPASDNEQREVAQNIWNEISRHAPRLEELYLNDNDGPCREIVDRFQKMSGFNYNY